MSFIYFPSIELSCYNIEITSVLEIEEQCRIDCQVKWPYLFALASTVYYALVSLPTILVYQLQQLFLLFKRPDLSLYLCTIGVKY